MIYVFDMDGTVTESRSKINEEMFYLLRELMSDDLVAIISGAEYKQMQSQLSINDGLNCLIMANSGNDTRGYYLNWQNKLNWMDKKHIFEWIDIMLNKNKIADNNDLVEDRIYQVAVSMVGHHADKDIKASYDKSGDKRNKILKEMGGLPNIHISVAGGTCFDFVEKGNDKGGNIKRLAKELDKPLSEFIYIGDALFEGGNDSTVIGVCKTHEVKTLEDTKDFIKQQI